MYRRGPLEDTCPVLEKRFLFKFFVHYQEGELEEKKMGLVGMYNGANV